MLRRWTRTVSLEILRASPIARAEWPSSMRLTTCASRAVRPAGAGFWTMGAAAAGMWRLASGPAIWQWRVTAAARKSADADSAFASAVVKRRLPVLREKDILQPEDANTPAKRVYFPVMMMYLDETAAGKVYDEFALRLSEFMGASRNPEILAACVAASRHVMAREYYKALMAARKLVEYEEGLANVAAGVQDRSLEG